MDEDSGRLVRWQKGSCIATIALVIVGIWYSAETHAMRSLMEKEIRVSIAPQMRVVLPDNWHVNPDSQVVYFSNHSPNLAWTVTAVSYDVLQKNFRIATGMYDLYREENIAPGLGFTKDYYTEKTVLDALGARFTKKERAKLAPYVRHETMSYVVVTYKDKADNLYLIKSFYRLRADRSLERLTQQRIML